jgi:hypothetical protein
MTTLGTSCNALQLTGKQEYDINVQYCIVQYYSTVLILCMANFALAKGTDY